MSNEDRDVLSQDVEELFAVERAAPPIPAAAKNLVFDRIQTSLAVGAAIGSPVEGVGSGAGGVAQMLTARSLVMGAFLLAVGSGVGVVAHMLFEKSRLNSDDLEAAVEPAVEPDPTPTDPAPSASTAANKPERSITKSENVDRKRPVQRRRKSQAPVIEPLATQEPTIAPKSHLEPESLAPNTLGDLAAERKTLELARAAIVRKDGVSALAALADHANRFPAGQFVEEREALRVKALAIAGRLEEARSNASVFRRRFSRSILLPYVDEAIAAAEKGD